MPPEVRPAHADRATPALALRWHRLHTSTRVLVAELLLIGVTMALLGATGYPLVVGYAWHKLLHILGAVLFLGNIIVTALWMSFTAATGQPALVRRAAEATQWADVGFTAPGVLLVVANGMVMVHAIGGLAAHPWALGGLVLFAASGVLWLVFLIPAQERMLRWARSAEEHGRALGDDFRRALRVWTVAGLAATLLPLAVLGLMVLRPGA